MMVCQKVEEKGTTTYNEVADELVKKVVAERRKEDPNGKFDEKNIRRRVYDALNVLMAMDIISKEKKEITWKGLPTAAKQDMDSMKKEIEYRKYQIEQKRESLRDLLIQQVCLRNLVQRNHDRGIVPDEKIPLPFIVVNTNQSAVIQCDMSGDRTDVMFDFSLPFEINDDNTILKKMEMDRTSISTLRQMLPEDLLQYCETNHLVDDVVRRGDPSLDDKQEEPSPTPRSSTSISISISSPSEPQQQQQQVTPAVVASSGLSVASSSMSR
ncbi:E2F_TDP-domain-containing protein, partial [Fragilariopsis cylindrus CCMP1102]